MRAVVSIILLLASIGYAHGGHNDEPPEPGAIENGKLKGVDNVTYLDAGPSIQWNVLKLSRKVSDSNQIIYKYQGETADLAGVTSSAVSSNLELKVPGAEILKAFAFDHAGESHNMIEVISPDFSNGIKLVKGKDLSLRWKADPTVSMLRIIIEIYDSNQKLKGRLTASTNDDGEFDLPAQLLGELPAGEGKIAIKRVWLGEFQATDVKDMIGVKCVVSLVGKITVLED